MLPVSVVIITKDESAIIEQCISKAKLITDDIVIVDNNSTDATPHIAMKNGCRVYYSNWSNYGSNKNKGIGLAKYDWILSIDADEIPDIELILSLHDLPLDDQTVAYDIKYQTYFGNKRVKHGRWGRDHHVRLFNRQQIKWSEPKVHEKLILSQNTRIEKLQGYLHHYSVANANECMAKAENYARLSAENYFDSGKRSNFGNLYLSPLFAFIIDYILFMGFMDGKEGLAIAKSIYKNKRFKYHHLAQLENALLKKEFTEGALATH
ncbi:MAG: glycosyltransferase family 2 protein [Mucilaginibacter sp.]